MMNLQVTLSLVLTVFGTFGHQAPATSPRHYELGTTYTYGYTSIILLNEPPPLYPTSNRTQGTDVGYQVAATVELTPVWQDPLNSDHLLLELLMKAPKLSIKSRKAPSADGFIPHSSSLDDQSESSAVYLDWNNGKISRIFGAESETTSLLNLKKGIASLFQVQDAKGEAKELDASGRCGATYQQIGDVTLLKKKHNCKLLRKSRSPSFTRAQKILGLSSVTENQWKYDLKKDTSVIHALTATEVHSTRVVLRSQAGASVISRQFLYLSSEAKSSKIDTSSSVEGAIDEIAKASGLKLVEDNMELVEQATTECEEDSCLNFSKAVSQLKTSLQSSKLASSSAADAFVDLVPIVRRSSKSEIRSVLTDSKNKKILPQLLDVIAAAQTAEAHQAAIEVVNFKSSSDIELPERYLVAVSLSTHPSESLLKDLLALSRTKIPSENLAQSATLCLAAVARTFQSIQKSSQEIRPIVSEIRQFLLDKLDNCEDETCRQLYLRSLKNLAMADTLPIIMKHIDNADRKTSATAVKALRALPSEVFDSAVKDKLENIYFQIGHRYDSSARTLALDMLLEHEPTSEFLTRALMSMSSKDKELSTYTLQRVMEFAGNNPIIRAQIKQILKDNPTVNNYHVLALDGQSTAFSRLMYRDVNGNGTFSSSNEVMSGVMKRSAFDIFLSNSEDSFQLLSFGLFTGGLTSMMGGGSDGDNEDATAGMEITLSGVQLRPLIFFTGNGELMGHIWSGTASERTSALQATVLLQDHRQLVPLQSGFIAVTNVLGSVSFDFGGEIQISIWNRNSHSVVDNMAAWGMEGSLSLSTPFVKSEVEFKVGAQAKIDFVSDVNFGGGLLACLQMGQKEFLLNHTVQKRESIPGTKHWIHKRRARQDVIPGRTYALNAKNSVLCNEMFAK